MGMALGIYKGGIGREAEAEVRITPAGRVEVHIGNVDVGQGSTTVLAQMAAEALEVPVHFVDMVMADTATTPPAPITAGSSTTITCGAAVKLAAEDAKRHLLERAATLLQAPAIRLEAGQLISAEAPQRRLDLAAAVAGLPGISSARPRSRLGVRRISSMPLPRTLPKSRWTCRAVASAYCAMWPRTIRGASCIL